MKTNQDLDRNIQTLKRLKLVEKKTQSKNWIEFKELEIPKMSFESWILQENKMVQDLIAGDSLK
jgi:hypothetical protein